jgi:hypothetical protein
MNRFVVVFMVIPEWKNKSMAYLRDALENAFQSITTYIQSGNIVFSSVGFWRMWIHHNRCLKIQLNLSPSNSKESNFDHVIKGNPFKTRTIENLNSWVLIFWKRCRWEYQSDGRIFNRFRNLEIVVMTLYTLLRCRLELPKWLNVIRKKPGVISFTMRTITQPLGQLQIWSKEKIYLLKKCPP